MRRIFASAFVLGLLGSSNACPGIGDWHDAKITPSGPLICAKLYGNSNCTGFPLLFGVNSSTSDMRHTLDLMGIGKGDAFTVLVRPLCRVTFWSDTDFRGEQDTSSVYRWSTVIDKVSSAACDCYTENGELLSCDPAEELRQIQWCDYSNSSTGGICPYTVDTRHFKRNDGSDNTTQPIRYLTTDETKAVNSLFAKRIAGAIYVPQILNGDEEKDMMYAFVKPHQSLRVSQRTILCGSYTLRTTELILDYEIALRGTWVLNPAVGRLFYFSLETERETRENAAARCADLGGHLAVLDRPEELDFAARIVLKNFDNNGTIGWWTAAALQPEIRGTRTRWLGWKGGMRPGLTYVSFTEPDKDLRCVLTKFVWPADPKECFFLTHCETTLPFVCEKYPVL